MFEVGDIVFHPQNGAGVILGLVKMSGIGDSKHYYKVKILGQIKTILMIPVEEANSIGLRAAITPRQLENVWTTLTSPPEELPDQNKTRYKLMKDKLQTGETLEIAKVVRDLAWRRKQKEHLNIPGRKLYKKGLSLLSGEVATAQGIELDTAESQIKAKLRENFSALVAA